MVGLALAANLPITKPSFPTLLILKGSGSVECFLYIFHLSGHLHSSIMFCMYTTKSFDLPILEGYSWKDGGDERGGKDQSLGFYFITST